jgi:hypothetical protein
MHSTSGTPDGDLDAIQAMLSQLNTFCLPRALKLKEQVDGGELLSAYEVLFLKQALNEGSEARRLVAKHPQYQGIVDQMTALYAEIVRKGAQNETDLKKPANDQH